MADREPSWDHYRAFLAVLEDDSLSGAARTLGLTQPTVGRQIDALEVSLGHKLFVRSQDGLAPTDAATRLAPHARILGDTAEAMRRVVDAAPEAVAGAVRITCSDVVGVEVLPPILQRLHEDHPGLAIELVLTDTIQDLLHRSADIAVRMAQPRQAALLCRRIGSIPLGLFAHRRYLDRRGVPRDVRELGGHAIIGFDRPTPYIRDMLRRGLPLNRDMFAFRSDSTLAQLAAIRAGLGIGFCQAPIACRSPDLLPVLAATMRADLPAWVAMHEDLRGTPRYRATFDALAEGLDRYITGKA